MPLSRRHFFALSLASLPAIAIACRTSAHSPAATETPTSELDARLARLDPALQDALRDYPDTPAHLSLLIDFLLTAAAQDPAHPRRELPLIISPTRTRSTPDLAFDLALQTRIIEQRTYRYLTLRPDHEIIVVYTAPRDFLSAVDVENVRAIVDTALPQVDRLHGGAYNPSWVHVRLFAAGSTNYTNGNNILLTETAQNRPAIVTHETCHLYNSQFAGRLPAFAIEGIPEAIAKSLTNDSVYEGYITNAPVRLSYITLGDSAAARAEAANGYDLFRTLVAKTSLETVMQGVNQTYALAAPTGLTLLRNIKTASKDPAAIEAVYRARIADYAPNSA